MSLTVVSLSLKDFSLSFITKIPLSDSIFFYVYLSSDSSSFIK